MSMFNISLQLLFLSGVTMIIGPSKTVSFFFQPRKLRGTICFILGIVLVMFKWVLIGILVQLFGFINLFGDFFPVVVSFLRRLPVIGFLLSLPLIAPIVDRITGSRLPV
ncbi:hypothetical protein MIR68_001854 [Amoeboaphelidium protococcarum]|nr:hypothetical protein MIR68_001854 [Amoeboaphelidium protococcarum]